MLMYHFCKVWIHESCAHKDLFEEFLKENILAAYPLEICRLQSQNAVGPIILIDPTEETFASISGE